MSYRDDDDLLNDPDKRVREARGVLSAIWRQFLVLRSVDGFRWDQLMRNYLNDPRNGIRNNSRDRSSARGNINKELLKRDDITWRVFLKALNFLDPLKIVFSVRVTFKDGKTQEVTATLRDRGKMRLETSGAPVRQSGRPSYQQDEDREYDDLENNDDGEDLDQIEDLQSVEHEHSRRF